MLIQLDRKKLSSKTDPNGNPWSYGGGSESCWTEIQDACCFFFEDPEVTTGQLKLRVDNGNIRNRSMRPNLDISPARKAFRYTLTDIAKVHNELASDVTGLLTLNYAEGTLQKAEFSISKKI